MNDVLNFIVNQLIWIIIVVILITLFFLSCIKAGPDKAVIISGTKKLPRVLIGRTGFKIPFFERVDQLPLQQLDVEIRAGKYVQTVDFIQTRVDAVATIRIGHGEEMLAEAMRNFLNKEPEEIAVDLQMGLQANIREVIGMMPFKEISTKQERFSEILHGKISPYLKKFGLEVLSLHIQTVEDENRLVKALGTDKTVEIQKISSIRKAEAERDVQITQIALEQEASEAKKLAEIVRMENEHELKLKAAELKKIADAKKAEAEAVFAETEQIHKQKLEQAEIKAKQMASEREIELKRRMADTDLYVQNKEAEIMRVEAEAKTYQAEQSSQLMKAQRSTLQEEAEALLYVRSKEVEAEKAKAAIAHYKDEQEIKLEKVRGLAEADILKAKKIAEADGIKAKGDAMESYGKATMLEMVVGVLPEVAKNLTRSNENNEPEDMKKIMAFIQEGTGLNIKEVLVAGDPLAEDPINNGQIEIGTEINAE